jgi:hypothetical protein
MLVRVASWISALLLCVGAQAAALTSTYTSLGGNSWLVAFDLDNDGSPTIISGFTVFFDEALFGPLTLLNSPGTWDSLLVQPDPAIPDAGFLDALAIDAADELGIGQSVGGWTVQVQYLGAGLPGALPFDIVDRSFDVLESGVTAVVLPVSEPGVTALLAAALLACGIGRRRGPLR